MSILNLFRSTRGKMTVETETSTPVELNRELVSNIVDLNDYWARKQVDEIILKYEVLEIDFTQELKEDLYRGLRQSRECGR